MITVMNDLHIGAVRSAGTTPSSALALRKFALNNLVSMLSRIEGHVVVLGDLFDTYQIPLQDLYETYVAFRNWQLRTKGQITLVQGNHDLSTDSSKMGSFQLLAELLAGAARDDSEVDYVSTGKMIADDVYAIGHCPNQDLFDLELKKVPECRYLLVHANYDNDFAKELDHSLNMSAEQVEAAPCEVVVFAHEHYHRTAQGGKVFVMGNQFPMSISDCLHNEDKFMHALRDDSISRIKTWDKNNYREVQWDQPIEEADEHFIRIVGHCKPEQAADMADMVARYRKNSGAFIVGNAVKVGADVEGEEISLSSLEALSKFDVRGALKKHLTDRENEIIDNLPR